MKKKGLLSGKFFLLSVLKWHLNRLSKWVAGLGARDFVTEFLSWHCAEVNPGEIMVEPSWLEGIIVNMAGFPLIVLNMTELQHNTDHVRPQARPNPDVGNLFSSSDLTSLGTKPEMLKLVEEHLVQTRTDALPKLAALTNDAKALKLLRVLEHRICSMLGSKKHKSSWETSVAGVLDKDKLDTLLKEWVLWVNNNENGAAAFAESMGVEAAAAVEDDSEVPLHILF